jgi:hypothetical protein
MLAVREDSTLLRIMGGFYMAKKPPQRTLDQLRDSCERALLAENLSHHTIESYLQSLILFRRYLEANNLSIIIEDVASDHVKGFLVDCLGAHSPATARNRYRGLKAFISGALPRISSLHRP